MSTEIENDLLGEALEEDTPDQTEKLAFDPKEIEATLIRQAQERADDPTETAATAYQMYVPHFKRLLPKLSTRQLRRCLQYLILYPLEQDSVNSASEFETQFMQMCSSLSEAKFVMILDSMRMQTERIVEANESTLTTEQKDGIVNELRSKGVPEEELERLIKENE